MFYLEYFSLALAIGHLCHVMAEIESESWKDRVEIQPEMLSVRIQDEPGTKQR